MLGVRVVSPAQALGTLLGQWNLFLFFTGLMLVSGLADAAGFFEAAGALAAGAARGSGRGLLLTVLAAGALITTFLSNDATALILTPVVYAVVTRLRLPPLPYLFATTFIADTASITLPVSNPINVLIDDRLRLSLGGYAAHLLGASLAAIVLNGLCFLLVFRRTTAVRFHLEWRAALATAVRERRLLRLTCAGLATLAVAYLLASAMGVPLGPVAVGGAILLAVLAVAARHLDLRTVREHFSPSLLIYVAGLLVLVQGVERAGLTEMLVGRLTGLVSGPIGAVGAGLTGGAVLANLLNNVPATLVLLSGAQGLAAQLRLPFTLGVLVGADLGPNLTPVGSLSTMLWLVVVRRRGQQVSALDYLRLGALITPGLLIAAGLALGATFRS
jgi:arsenical pump membrane protein